MLWATTSYFNPLGYRARLNNYRLFRRNLNTPLLTIELGFDGRFDLSASDADILVRVSDGDVLFQKERLLNQGIIQHLPAECNFVAWLDCDILFLNQAWQAETKMRLDRGADLLQLFTIAKRLEEPCTSLSQAEQAISSSKRSIVHEFNAGRLDAENWCKTRLPKSTKSKYSCGLAWAARRDWISDTLLYDACVLGSGDRAFVAALFGQDKPFYDYMKMTDSFAQHYRNWCSKLRRQDNCQFQSVYGEVVSLWHGNYVNRQYRKRHQIYREVDYQPTNDLLLGNNGAWRWTDPNSRLASYTYDYFGDRREDSKSPENSPA